jgi:hypothetical protein
MSNDTARSDKAKAVEPGDAIAKLNGAKAEMKEAEGKLDKAEGKLDKAKREVDKAKGELDKAKGELVKAKADKDQDATTRAGSAIDRATTECDSALEGVKTAQEGVKTAQAGITRLEGVVMALSKTAYPGQQSESAGEQCLWWWVLAFRCTCVSLFAHNPHFYCSRPDYIGAIPEMYRKFDNFAVGSARVKLMKVLGENGVMAVKALFIDPTDVNALNAFVAQVVALPFSRTRQYFADEHIFCDGTISFGSITFMRAFKSDSSVPMLIKLTAEDSELLVYNQVAMATSVKSDLDCLVPCEVRTDIFLCKFLFL